MSRRDVTGARPNTHDLDLHLPDGSVIALEVTRETRAGHIAMRHAVAERSWQFDSIERAWQVWTHVTRVKRLHMGLPALLRRLEEAEIRDAASRDHNLDPDVVRELQSLGVARAAVLDGHYPGAVFLNHAAEVGSAGAPDIVVPVIERHAAKTDNVTKLAHAVADERHLMVWIDSDCHEYTIAMRLGHLPHKSPTLPAAVDAVWIAPAYAPPPIVWCFNATSGWSEHPHVDTAP